MQHKPGMAAALPDPAVRDHIVLRAETLALLVDRAQFIGTLERAVFVSRLPPRDVTRAGDVSTTQRALLRIGFHVQEFASVFLRAAHVYQRMPLGDVIFHLVAERAIFVIGPLRRFVLRGRIAGLILRYWTPFV